MNKIKLCLSIRSLDIGGAERQFIELVKYIDKKRFDVYVCTMYGGAQEELIKNLHVKYFNLKKKGRYDFLGFYFKYKKILNQIKPDVIYSFLGEMNLFSLWCKTRKSKIIWGFRASNMDFEKYGQVSQSIFWLQKKLSKYPDLIISNSKASVLFHKKEGFYMEKAVVIHNGIDTEKFKKNYDLREYFRKQYKLKDQSIAIGIVARIDIMKGYEIFAKAAKKILNEFDNVTFFAIGNGDENIKKRCEDILAQYNKTRFIWLGKILETEKIYSGLDVASSSSLGEGFSNSIAEAMSCEVPCVVTDVGDSAYIVKDTGIVVKPNDIDAFYNALKKILLIDKNSLGKKARNRILENFSINKMTTQTEMEIFNVWNRRF